MWKTSAMVSAVLCILALASVTTGGSIELAKVLSVDIPGIQAIQKYDLDDVDFDGQPEMLVSDGSKVVLYSYARDSVLYSTMLSGNPLPADYGIILDDINRDWIPDIVIGVYDGSTTLRVKSWDGLGFYGLPDSTSLTYTGGGYSYEVIGLTLFDAIDTDGDNCHELAFAFDSSGTPDDGYWTATIRGVSRVYHSFPDSLAWSVTQPLSNPVSIYLNGGGTAVYTEIRGGCSELAGSDTYNQGGSIVLAGDIGAKSGQLNTTLSDQHAYPSPQQASYNYDYSYAVCAGDISGNGYGGDFVVCRDWSHCSYDYPDWNCTSGRDLSLCRFISPDSIDIRWSKSPPALPNICVYLPDQPGYFFGFIGDRFVQFKGTDGSEVQSTTQVPTGIRSWHNLFLDGKPHLVAANGTTVSIYQPAVVTGIDDREEPPLPSILSLGAPYPNPFNTAQTIPVMTMPGKMLTVDIYNLLGQKLENIYSGISHTQQLNITWKADKFSSGIYLIRAVMEGEEEVVKSVFLK